MHLTYLPVGRLGHSDLRTVLLQRVTYLSRLRTGHTGPNHHLSRKLNIAPPPPHTHTPLCQCNQAAQTASHILHGCTLLQRMRRGQLGPTNAERGSLPCSISGRTELHLGRSCRDAWRSCCPEHRPIQSQTLDRKCDRRKRRRRRRRRRRFLSQPWWADWVKTCRLIA